MTSSYHFEIRRTLFQNSITWTIVIYIVKVFLRLALDLRLAFHHIWNSFSLSLIVEYLLVNKATRIRINLISTLHLSWTKLLIYSLYLSSIKILRFWFLREYLWLIPSLSSHPLVSFLLLYLHSHQCSLRRVSAKLRYALNFDYSHHFFSALTGGRSFNSSNAIFIIFHASITIIW